MKKTQHAAVLITGALLLLAFATAAQAQHRSRLKAPKALLDLLDKQDRDCIGPGGLQKSVTVTPIRLARDGSQQILVRGSGICLCGAQNCLFWIYRKTGAKYELILTGAGSTKVKAGRKSAHGYREVISESHASASETIIRTYRYEGSAYRSHSCVNRAYYNDNGESTKKPTLRPCFGEKKSEPESRLSASLLDRDLITIDNQHLKLSDYSDRIVVLNFFATWCAPCRMFLPDLIELKLKYVSRPIQIIGVVPVASDQDQDEVRKFVDRMDINFQVVWGTRDFIELIQKDLAHREVLPLTIVIDRAGLIRKSFYGFNSEFTPRLLREALDQMPPG